MGRKRVSNPRISFSISVDSHLLNKLNMRIGYNQSRSRWIADAIRIKLSNEEEGADAVGKASMAEIRVTERIKPGFISCTFSQKISHPGQLRED